MLAGGRPRDVPRPLGGVRLEKEQANPFYLPFPGWLREVTVVGPIQIRVQFFLGAQENRTVRNAGQELIAGIFDDGCRSGKTVSGIRPLLDGLLAPELPHGTVGCVLVVDPKRELWDVVADRGARLIDIGTDGGPAVNLMAGDEWDVTADIAAGRYLAAAERILVRSASLTRLSPANALAGRPSGGHNQYWQTDGARMATTAVALTLALLDRSADLFVEQFGVGVEPGCLLPTQG